MKKLLLAPIIALTLLAAPAAAQMYWGHGEVITTAPVRYFPRTYVYRMPQPPVHRTYGTCIGGVCRAAVRAPRAVVRGVVRTPRAVVRWRHW